MFIVLPVFNIFTIESSYIPTKSSNFPLRNVLTQLPDRTKTGFTRRPIETIKSGPFGNGMRVDPSSKAVRSDAQHPKLLRKRTDGQFSSSEVKVNVNNGDVTRIPLKSLLISSVAQRAVRKDHNSTPEKFGWICRRSIGLSTEG